MDMHSRTCFAIAMSRRPRTAAVTAADCLRARARLAASPARFEPASRRAPQSAASATECGRCVRCSIRCSPRSRRLSGIGPKLEKLYRPPARPRARRRASSTCCSICRPARSTGARGRSCATWCPTPWSPSRSRSTAIARRRPPPARALPDLRQRRHRRSRPDLFQRAQGLSREAAARSASCATCPARSRSTTDMLQMVHPDRVVAEADLAKLPLVEPVYPLTEGLEPQPGAQGRRGRARAPAGAARMAGREPGSRASVSRRSREALRSAAPAGRAGRRAARETGLVAARL